MLNRSRTAMALLLATSVYALPTHVLAAQESGSEVETRSKTEAEEKPKTSLQRNARAERTFHIAGPSPRALRASRDPAAQKASQGRRYTEEELAEIRAAQIALVRSLTSGQSGNPEGRVVSHPTLGRIMVKGPAAALAPAPGGSGGILRTSVPGLLAGPSPSRGAAEGQPQSGSREPGEPGAGGSDPVDFPVLQPGAGFSGPTAQPPAVGNPHLRGYDAKAIARWDVVPYQDFDGQFHIGVVAFHMNGIDRVEFSVDGGPWTPVYEMKLNPRTDVWEYTATLDATLFADGQVEVRAKVYPRNAGEVRVLGGELTEESMSSGTHSMLVFANPSKTEPDRVYVALSGDDSNSGEEDAPVRTLTEAVYRVSDGGEVIILEAGTYEPPSRRGPRINNERYLTIRSADTLDRKDVTLAFASRQGARPEILRLKLQGVTFDYGFIGQLYQLDKYTWLDDVLLTDSRSWAPSSADQNLQPIRGSYWVTNSRAEDILYGFTDGDLVRNTEYYKISGDVLQNSGLVINASIDRVDGTVLGHHTDVYQMFGGRENLIVYGLQATNLIDTQTLFLEPTFRSAPGSAIHTLEDAAFVDFSAQNSFVTPRQIRMGGPAWSQMLSRFDHVLFKNVALPNQRFILRDDITSNQEWGATNVVFDSCTLFPVTYDSYVNGEAPDGTMFIDCRPAESGS